MKLKRSGAALSVLAASTLLLSACGSDNNTGATGSTGATGAGSTSNVECGGKSALKGQWFAGSPGQRHDAFRECVRAGVQRTDPQLHLQRLRRRCEVSSSETRPTSVVPILRSARTRASTTARKNAAPATPGTFPSSSARSR